MTNEPGTYVLWMHCGSGRELAVGRLGVLRLEPGFYAYIGSAFGPGGLAARIGHHAGIAVRPHWHVDYLRALCPLIEVWFTNDPRRQEHAWANALSTMPNASIPLPGFGSSDCECATHLFRFDHPLTLASFRRSLDPTSIRSVLAAELSSSSRAG